MESKKNLQFNDDFENFILSFSVSHGAIEHLISFLLFHISKCITQRVGGRAREIVGLLAAPSVLETGNISSQWLSFLPSQILIELELSQEVNSWQGLPVASKLIRYGLRSIFTPLFSYLRTILSSVMFVLAASINPLPHCGRPYLPITSLNANCSKSAEGKV